MSRAPVMRRIGHPFTRRDGSVMQPMAFIHPCFKEGCDNPACQGVGVALLRGKPGLWACPQHLSELILNHGDAR